MAHRKDCPKCGGAMSDGFIVDKDSYGGRSVATWVEGQPKKSIWVGLRLGDAARFEITTWRCERCGFLESYAAAE